MTGNTTPINALSNDMTLTHDPEFTTSFDGLDADFGAGYDASGDFSWDSGTGFTAVNNGTGASSTSTVSPKDLFNEYLGSNPPSTAFTNLTSPDINESPYLMASSTEVSPMFSHEELGAGSDMWPSLFPDASDSTLVVAPPMERNDSNVTDSSSGDSPLILDEHNFRRKPSNTASPGHGRHSSISGVKPRRRKAPLLPILVDKEDKTAVKRARNTLAARESRQRKLDHLGGLEARIKELEDRELEFKATLAQYGYNGPLMQM
jgi:general control protein GCN4